MRFRNVLLFLSAILLASCGGQTQSVNSCKENPGNGKLFVFIGERIEVKELTDEKDIMDAKFLAKYKILERVCGDFPGNTIEFTVYDHYGRPDFENYKTVMLYVSEHEGKYYHEKYQFAPLYKTKDGRWAGPYDSWDYAYTDIANNPVKPQIIDFAEEVAFSVAGWKKRDIQAKFPTPFYKIVDTNAIAIYGNYIPELFELKKRGVLTARGLYGEPSSADEVPVQPMELERFEKYIIPKAEQKALIGAWQQLFSAIEANDAAKVKALSLDSVACAVCEGFASPHFYNDIEPIDSFIAAGNRNFPNTELWKNMKSGTFKLNATKYPDRKPQQYQLPNNESLVIYEITFPLTTAFEESKYQLHHNFQFVKTKTGFRFFGMESH